MKKRRASRGRNSHRSRQVSQAARDAILQAAEEEFAAAGFGGARAQRIASRAKVNKALPFYHFGSKADLYDEVMRRVWERLGLVLTAHAQSPQQPPIRLGGLIHNLVMLLARDQNALRLLVRELIDDRARARETAQLYFVPLVQRLCDIIATRIREGRIIEVEPVQVVITILSEVIFYFLIAPFLEGAGLKDPLLPEGLANREKIIMTLILRGFRPEGPTNI